MCDGVSGVRGPELPKTNAEDREMCGEGGAVVEGEERGEEDEPKPRGSLRTRLDGVRRTARSTTVLFSCGCGVDERLDLPLRSSAAPNGATNVTPELAGLMPSRAMLWKAGVPGSTPRPMPASPDASNRICCRPASVPPGSLPDAARLAARLDGRTAPGTGVVGATTADDSRPTSTLTPPGVGGPAS